MISYLYKGLNSNQFFSNLTSLILEGINYHWQKTTHIVESSLSSPRRGEKGSNRNLTSLILEGINYLFYLNYYYADEKAHTMTEPSSSSLEEERREVIENELSSMQCHFLSSTKPNEFFTDIFSPVQDWQVTSDRYSGFVVQLIIPISESYSRR